MIPDDLWVRLHPELQPRSFYVIAAMGERAQLALRIWAKHFDVRWPKRKPLTADEAAIANAWPAPDGDPVADLLATVNTVDREVLARNADLPEDVLATLAADRKGSVRIALAEWRALPEAIQRTL